MTQDQAVIICEGYVDRHFWRGALLHAGATNPRPQEVAKGRRSFRDPWGEQVQGGDFALFSKSGQFIRIRPAQGRDSIPEATELLLRERQRHPIRSLVINVDSDEFVSGAAAVERMRRSSIDDLIRRKVDSGAEVEREATWLFGRTLAVYFIAWSAGSRPAPGLPDQQTLERMLCGAIAAARPQQPPLVQAWLDSLKLQQLKPKQYSWSYLAGWYSDTGSYEGFVEKLWNDAPIAAELEKQFAAMNAWEIVCRLAA